MVIVLPWLRTSTLLYTSRCSLSGFRLKFCDSPLHRMEILSMIFHWLLRKYCKAKYDFFFKSSFKLSQNWQKWPMAKCTKSLILIFNQFEGIFIGRAMTKLNITSIKSILHLPTWCKRISCTFSRANTCHEEKNRFINLDVKEFSYMCVASRLKKLSSLGDIKRIENEENYVFMKPPKESKR